METWNISIIIIIIIIIIITIILWMMVAYKWAKNIHRQIKKKVNKGQNILKWTKITTFIWCWRFLMYIILFKFFFTGSFIFFDSFCVHIHLEFYHKCWKKWSFKLERCHKMYINLNSRQGKPCVSSSYELFSHSMKGLFLNEQFSLTIVIIRFAFAGIL